MEPERVREKATRATDTQHYFTKPIIHRAIAQNDIVHFKKKCTHTHTQVCMFAHLHAHAYTQTRRHTRSTAPYLSVICSDTVGPVGGSQSADRDTRARRFYSLKTTSCPPRNKQRWSESQRRKRLIDRNCGKNWKWKMWKVKTTGRMWVMSQNSKTIGREARWSIRILKFIS